MARLDRDRLQQDSEDLARLWRDKGADRQEWAESAARARIEQQLQEADAKTKGTILARFLFAGHVAARETKQEHLAGPGGSPKAPEADREAG